MKKWLNENPVAKNAIILGTIAIWLIGLSDQMDFTQIAKYVGISILLVVVSRI